MNVTSEMLSRYADGEVSAEEAVAVEAALVADPALEAEYSELRLVGDLFGLGEPDPEISEDLRERLYAMRPAAELKQFEVVEVTPPARRGWSWGTWAAAAAILALCLVGYQTLVHKPEVRIYGYAKMTLDVDGNVIDTRTHDELKRRAGDFVKAEANERISFRLADGSWVYLMPGSALELGDPRDAEMFEVHRGTALCTAQRQEAGAKVRAGAYTVHVSETAQFGVRIEGADVRPAGPDGATAARVTVGVGKGRVEVGENGDRRTVEAYERVVLQKGAPVEAAAVYADPLYVHLMRYLHAQSRPILPGYETGERGVIPISRRKWERTGKKRVLTMTAGGAGLAGSTHLVLYARAKKSGALTLTRVRPRADEPGVADAVTVKSAPLGRDWTVIAIPLSAFRSGDATSETRKISAGRSRLVRYELEAADSDNKYELKASLWAARPPVALSEVVR